MVKNENAATDKERKKPYNNQKVCWVCQEELNEKINENESYCKLPVL